jgi:branched-chain amino acid aminotransferase
VIKPIALIETAFPWAHRKGTIVPYSELSIHAESMAMRYALSAFEGVRGYVQVTGGVLMFALDEHVERLSQTLALVALPPIPSAVVYSVVEEIIEHNRPEEDCYLRIAANATSMGTLKVDAQTELFVSLHQMGRKPIPPDGLAVLISTRRKAPNDAFPQQAKVIGNYAGPRLAYLEARAAGFDDVILLGPSGQLAEAPTANLFIARGGIVATPRLNDGILPGITRRHIIQLCNALGCTVEERAIFAEDALVADEAWLSGTGIELAPIARFNDRTLPAVRQLFPKLLAAYGRRVRGQEGE